MSYYIYCMEAVFLIRTLNIEGSTKGKTIFFEDMGEWNQVRETKSNLLENLTHFAYTQIRTQFSYLAGDATNVFQYRTRGGAIIPLAFKNKAGVLGIIPVLSAANAQNVMGSVNSFLKTYANSKVIIVHPEVLKPSMIQPRVLVASIGQVV